MRKIVLLDVDGVLADFTSAYLRAATKVTGIAYTPEQVDQWSIGDAIGLTKDQRHEADNYVREAGFCAGLGAFPGALRAVRALRQVADVYAVTTPFSDARHWHYERTCWLRDEFIFKKNEIIFAEAKQLVRGDVFVDDKFENVEKWGSVNMGRGVLWSSPSNGNALVNGSYIRRRSNCWGAVYYDATGRNNLELCTCG